MLQIWIWVMLPPDRKVKHMKTLALVMIVKNEERCLAKCLERIEHLVDKIYITDTGSTDRTKEIAASFGAVITDYVWKQDFADARNFSLAQSDCDWNLVLDADEYLLKGSREDICDFMDNAEQIGVIERQDLYLEDTKGGKEQIGSMYSWTTRLLPKGITYQGRIHEQVDSTFPLVPVPLLFEHDGYLQPGKGERNLKILCEELKMTPNDPYLLFQIGQTLRGLERYDQACDYYARFYEKAPIKGAGYRTAGIISWLYSLIETQNYDTALAIAQNEMKNLEDNADFHFACGILFMRAIQAETRKYIKYLPYIEKSYLRCLEIGEVPLDGGIYGCGSFKAAHNLGAWYEVTGNISKALKYYKFAAENDYHPSIARLDKLQDL